MKATESPSHALIADRNKSDVTVAKVGVREIYDEMDEISKTRKSYGSEFDDFSTDHYSSESKFYFDELVGN